MSCTTGDKVGNCPRCAVESPLLILFLPVLLLLINAVRAENSLLIDLDSKFDLLRLIQVVI